MVHRSFDRLSIARLRKRLPLPVFVVVVILLLVMLGLACLCISHHPTQAAERAISTLANAPALVTMWAFFIALLVPRVVLFRTITVDASGRASPVTLQRFRL